MSLSVTSNWNSWGGSRAGNKELDFSSQLTVSPQILLFEANLDLHWLKKINVDQEMGV